MPKDIYQQFIDTVWEYYNLHQRVMPWRIPESDGVFDPYKILISEIMLQQTQVDRVRPKYELFVREFPDVQSLAEASFADVLGVWSGLGYNRRAKYLHDFAKENSSGQFPKTIEELTKYSGIGPNTASAVLVYSFNEPCVFIETNIRTVYLHHFFAESSSVDDKEILAAVEQTIDRNNPREWYWALMDYGSYLKKSGIKNLPQSKQYKKQSKFEGSDRQIRGEILRQLLKNTTTEKDQLGKIINDERFNRILMQLEKDKLIQISGDTLRLL